MNGNGNGKIADYTLIETRFTDDLALRVQEAIALGWQPYGPLLKVQKNASSSVMIQPMVMDETAYKNAGRLKKKGAK